MNTLVLTWLDQNGVKQRREFKQHESRQARKAAKWLSDNGAKEIDIAIRINKRPA